MFNLIQSVIETGGFKLAEMQLKIKKMYMLGDITEAQMDDLLALASGSVNADAERPETLAMLRSLSERIDTVEERLKVLEGGGHEEPGNAAYPEWKPWDGISKDYANGAIVTHNGEVWISKLSVQNVWEPGVAGTEAMWVKYKGE